MIKQSNKFLALIILLAAPVLAQQNSNSLLNDLQNKLNTIDDLSADFTQQTNGKVFLSGLFTVKKENKLMINSDKILIISNGSTSWNYNKKENKVIITNYDANEPGVFSINELVYRFPDECEVTEANENGQAILTLVPNSYEYNFDSVKIWLNTENLIEKVFIVDAGSGRTEINFSNYKLNQNIKDSEFSFIPPEGSKIIDLR